MKNTRIVDNQIYFSRQGELIKLSSCGENTIRFQGFPDGKEIQENYTLLPGNAPVEIEEGEHHISMRCGTMRADLWENGKLTFFYKGNKILEEKPEMTFGMGFRRYENKGSNLWGARVTFEPNGGEHFFDHERQHIYPKADFVMSTRCDALDLVIRVTRDEEGRLVAERIKS
jgi:hypothetical protein